MNFFYILSGPLGYVMEWIYKLLPSYGWDIILFTLLINIVKIPLQTEPAEEHGENVGLPAHDRRRSRPSTRTSPKSSRQNC